MGNLGEVVGGLINTMAAQFERYEAERVRHREALEAIAGGRIDLAGCVARAREALGDEVGTAR
jgi:hypothetical protein